MAGKQPASKSAPGGTQWEARCRHSPLLIPVLAFLGAWDCFQLRKINHHGFCLIVPVCFFLISLELIWSSLGSSGKSKVLRVLGYLGYCCINSLLCWNWNSARKAHSLPKCSQVNDRIISKRKVNNQQCLAFWVTVSLSISEEQAGGFLISFIWLVTKLGKRRQWLSIFYATWRHSETIREHTGFRVYWLLKMQLKRKRNCYRQTLISFFNLYVVTSVEGPVVRNCWVPGVAEQISHSPKSWHTNLRVLFCQLSRTFPVIRLQMCSIVLVNSRWQGSARLAFEAGVVLSCAHAGGLMLPQNLNHHAQVLDSQSVQAEDTIGISSFAEILNGYIKSSASANAGFLSRKERIW